MVLNASQLHLSTSEAGSHFLQLIQRVLISFVQCTSFEPINLTYKFTSTKHTHTHLLLSHFHPHTHYTQKHTVAMAAKKRVVQKEPAAASEPTRPTSETNSTSKPEDHPIAPPKGTPVLTIFVPLLILYCYGIFYRYKIESELKISILINAGVSFVGFWVTRAMIPVASKYVLRRNLFGYDINKKGTPQGSVKV